MADFPFELVGFDLDGTLLDTSADLAAAVNHALTLGGYQAVAVERVRPMIGGGAKMMLLRALEDQGGADEAEVTRLYYALLDYYEANISAGSVPFPGMVAALDELDLLGVTVAVVTNKFEKFAVKLLTELGLIDRFKTVIGGDTMGKEADGRRIAKPDRAPIDEMIRRCGGTIGVTPTAFVGNSIYDTGAAKAAGIPSIACSFGFLMGPVEDLGADAVIDHYDELVPTLKALRR